jgi:hypothetical protein
VEIMEIEIQDSNVVNHGKSESSSDEPAVMIAGPATSGTSAR